MTAVLKALLCGQTKKLAVLGSGLQCNQTTGTTKTVCTLLALGMDTLGMTCPAITASTLLVSQVINILHNVIKIHCNLLTKNDQPTQNLARIVLRAQKGSMVHFQNNLLQTSTVNITCAFEDHFIIALFFQI